MLGIIIFDDFHGYSFNLFLCVIFIFFIFHYHLIRSYIIFYQLMGNCQSGSAVNAIEPKYSERVGPLASSIPLQDGDQFDIIVVGGGIGGVSAAVQLSNSQKKVGLLEANNYLGGRLKTQDVGLQNGGRVQFDEGASWIHGSCGENPISKLSKRVPGLVTKITEDDSAQVYDEDGQPADEKAQQSFQIYQKLMEKGQKYDRTQSMMDIFGKQEEGILDNKYFMYNVSSDVEFQTSSPLNDLSCQGVDDDQFEGEQELILSGYQRFAQTLAKLANFSVYLNQKVKKVISQEGTNKIVCSNGISVYAKNVVIAVPLGVLKSHAIQFTPQLPEWKQEAIQSIGFGNVCKILLDFKNGDFIDPTHHYIGVVSEDVNRRGLGTYFLNLKAIAGIPSLMTFGLGANADQAENMSESELKGLLAKRISAFAKRNISPSEFKMYRTKWKGDQNFQGVYAYGSVTTKTQHWENIAKPVFQNNWYFCGEHTTSKYRGTVHGAYLSGLEAAQSIIDEVNEDDWKYQEQE